MPKYFGTDGIRGRANEELTSELAYRTGLALACVLHAGETNKPRVLIGRDTRLSGGMLEGALTAGLCAAGADVVHLGVLPTPAVAYLTVCDAEADAGIVLSASHNPFADNGIKIFGGDGYKLTDGQEAEIEHLIDNPPALSVTGDALGALLPYAGGDPAALYVRHIADCALCRLDGLRVLADCANGAASHTAEVILRSLGADVQLMYAAPDGVNINTGCGSTHIGALQKAVKNGNFHAGVAFDGDADRCLVVDERGEVIDGDRILGVLAADMQRRGTLRGGVVGTILTNLGLKVYLESIGLDLTATDVGDRYVLEEMRHGGHNLGGEQSGHVILSDFATTGDGELTAVRFLGVLKQSGEKASQLHAGIEQYPQVTINVEMPNDRKKLVASLPEVEALRTRIAEAFAGKGRVVIRPSGTEPKVRVMVEGNDGEKVKALAEEAAKAIAALR
ncbi:MAG: phosphoglucosamine mutase [Clostridiaceae bacterium]|nr:phosphoglucosamine mutase [Clostridiaceae bacterium]